MDQFKSSSSREDHPTRQPDFVTALARGLSVIRAFGPGAQRMALAEIARRVGLPRATVRRALITLETLGYAESDGRTFALTPKVLGLGHAYLSSSPFARAAQPMLEKVAETLRESAWAAILDEDEVLVVAGARTNRQLSAEVSVGSRLPAYCSALGRVLLAGRANEELDDFLAQLSPRTITSRTVTDLAAIRRAIVEARTAGYAIADGEVETGLCSIAVPVANDNGQVAAALNVTTPSDRARGPELLTRIVPALRRAADELRTAIG